ncbi:MAG TPA: hypothetical protein VMM13_17550, partial [Euzebya sp.]|nr:hypothetical protein [Euzebya sp.]
LDLGLAAILAFVGMKMLIVEYVHLPIPLSLGVIFGVLAVAISASLWADRADGPEPAPADTGATPADPGAAPADPEAADLAVVGREDHPAPDRPAIDRADDHIG